MKAGKGQSQPEKGAAAFLILYSGSGSTMLIPGFDYGSHLIADST